MSSALEHRSGKKQSDWGLSKLECKFEESQYVLRPPLIGGGTLEPGIWVLRVCRESFVSIPSYNIDIAYLLVLAFLAVSKLASCMGL